MQKDVNSESKRQRSELSLSKTCYKLVIVFSFVVSFSRGVSEELNARQAGIARWCTEGKIGALLLCRIETKWSKILTHDFDYVTRYLSIK